MEIMSTMEIGPYSSRRWLRLRRPAKLITKQNHKARIPFRQNDFARTKN